MDESTLRRAMGGAGGAESGNAPPGGPDLSQIFASMTAGGTPDFTALAKASGMDPGLMKTHASRLWKQMDELAGDPEAYQSFLREKARDAGVDPGGGGAGGGGDHLCCADSNSVNVPGMETPLLKTPGYQRSHEPTRATFLAPTPLVLKTRQDVVGQKHGVGVVAVWRAAVDLASLLPVPSDPTGKEFVKTRLRAPVRVEKVALPDPRVGPEGVEKMFFEATSAAAGPPPMDASVYDIETHPDAVDRALGDPTYQAFLIESATQFAEQLDPSVVFIRHPPGGRRCYARRGEASAFSATAAAAAETRRSGLCGTENLSVSLLTELAGMGVSMKTDCKAASFVSPQIKEVKASHAVMVDRDANGTPTLVTVTLHLPQLTSTRLANLEVSQRLVTLDPGVGEPRVAVATPFAIRADDATAKWNKKLRTLTIKAAPVNCSVDTQ